MSEHAVAEKLHRRLLADINSGKLSPGSKLGSERQLAEDYGVSRATLRQVLAALDEAGLVRRVSGRAGGTFIAHAQVERDLTRLMGLPAYLARQGYAAGSRIISTKLSVADDATTQALQLPKDSLVIELKRIRLADGTPISLDLARLPADRFAGLLEMPLGGSLYELLERGYGTVPADAVETVEVVHATDDEAQMLDVERHSPLLSITRTAYDEEGHPFEFSHDLFRADRTRILLRTPGQGIRESARNAGDYVELGSPPGGPRPQQMGAG